MSAVGKARRQGRVPGLPRLLGEMLCLDFVNTIEARLGDHPQDALSEPSDLALWAMHANAVDDDSAERVREALEAEPSSGQRELARALALRENAYAVLSAAAAGRSVEDGALADISRAVTSAYGRGQLNHYKQRFVLTPAVGIHHVTDLVALDLNTLLTSDQLSRVRQCPGCGDCGWLFLDRSCNGTRQWCSMEGCGSRAKMRRHYRRQRAASTKPGRQ